MALNALLGTCDCFCSLVLSCLLCLTYDSTLCRGSDSGGYYHELFLRGRPGLVVNMKRTKVKGTKKRRRDPETEPKYVRYCNDSLPLVDKISHTIGCIRVRPFHSQLLQLPTGDKKSSAGKSSWSYYNAQPLFVHLE